MKFIFIDKQFIKQNENKLNKMMKKVYKNKTDNTTLQNAFSVKQKTIRTNNRKTKKFKIVAIIVENGSLQSKQQQQHKH